MYIMWVICITIIYSMREIIVDTETTGLTRGNDVVGNHRIIEIACIEVVDGEQTGRVFHTHINPGRKIDPAAEKVHGISDGMVEKKPKFNEIANAFFRFISNSPLVFHNADFDIAFLDNEFKRLSRRERPRGTLRFIDTLQIARERFPLAKNNLDALVERFGIEDKRMGGPHGALVDAKMLADVYIHLT